MPASVLGVDTLMMEHRLMTKRLALLGLARLGKTVTLYFLRFFCGFYSSFLLLYYVLVSLLLLLPPLTGITHSLLFQLHAVRIASHSLLFFLIPIQYGLPTTALKWST